MLVMVTVTWSSRSLVLVMVTDEVTSWHSLGCKTSPDTYTNAESKISVKKIAMSNVFNSVTGGNSARRRL